MEKEYIDFQKERDFGQVLNDTFQFIGQEFKPMGQVILIYVLPIIILASVITGVFINNAFNWAEMFEYAETFPPVGNFFGQVSGAWILSLLSYLFLLLAVYCYISLYVERGRGNFEKEDVWKKMTQNILPVIGTGIVVGLIIGIGLIFCVIPGIYFGVSLSLIFIILIHEGHGFSYSFSRSFELTKLQWWWTLLLLIVFTIIVSITSGIISIPIGINAVFRGIQFAQEKMVTSEFFGPFATAYIVLVNIISYLLYTIIYVAISFQYFNLVEVSKRPTLAERIAAMDADNNQKNKEGNS